jgi:hypothetical protein
VFITDYIRVYESAFPPDMCDELIRRFEASGDTKHELDKMENEEKPIRSYLELGITKDHKDFLDIQAVLMKLTEMASLKYQSEVPVRTFPREIGCETFRVQKFRNGTDDCFKYHVDVQNYASARRFVALNWFLNDVEKGAELYFPHPNIRIQPRQGRLVLYPATWMYPHAVEPCVTGDSYVITTYLHYVG